MDEFYKISKLQKKFLTALIEYKHRDRYLTIRESMIVRRCLKLLNYNEEEKTILNSISDHYSKYRSHEKGYITGYGE